MAWGLPKLPGLTFSDPTKTQFHRCPSLRFRQGYMWPTIEVMGSGKTPTDADSNAFALAEDSVNYDPSLTYGRVKQAALPQVIPHWVTYDQRCLNFTAFFKQPVYDNPDETFRVRIVNLIYFLQDDTMCVMEPTVRNSGIWQGRIVKRGKLPKNDMDEYWHWKDLDVGKDICIYGRVFHTCTCDLYTREWLASQGIELSKEEELPTDEYTQKEYWKTQPVPQKKKAKKDPLRRFLEYDGKVLAFDVVWDDRDSAFGELEKYKMLYFLNDDTMSIKELHDGQGGKDPFPLLMKKLKVPKKWKERPVDFPSISMEMSEEEVTEFYAPRDLIVGETIFILGRRFLIYDCDGFTRTYYKSMLNIDQPPPVKIPEKPKKEIPKVFPPHIMIGTPEDTLQSCFGLEPKAPHKDIIRYNINASKYLRYLCELDYIHPEDEGRKFVLAFSLADSNIKISEIPRRNSGRREGVFLKSMKLELPDSDHNFPTYFTPDKFYIGAIIPVFKHRFKIIGCDLFVYRYMLANPEKFPKDVIDNVRNYHMREGNLKDELEFASREEQTEHKRAELAKYGQQAVKIPSNMEQCLTALKVEEGSSEPIRPPTPPETIEHLSYEEALRSTRLSKPPCQDVVPLKGILKSGLAPKDDQQKVVCFAGPDPGEHREEKKVKPIGGGYVPGTQPHYDDDPDYCLSYKEPKYQEREARRKRHECNYEIVPKPPAPDTGGAELEPDPNAIKYNLPGYLGTYGVDCKQVPDYMRMPGDAYKSVKHMRKDVPDISPAAQRIADHPRTPFPPVDTCVNPPPEATGPCAPRKEEDVAFTCPHVEPVLPCCPEDKKERERVLKAKEPPKEAPKE